MAITHVGTTTVQSFSETVVANMPAGTAEGDLLLFTFIIGAGNTTDTSMPTGATLLQRDTADSFRSSQLLAYAIYDGASSYSFTNAPVKASRLIVNAFRGVNQVTPIASSGKSTQYSNSASINSTSISVTNTDSLEFFSCADLDNASRTFTPPAGFTELLNRASYPSLTMCSRAVSPSATAAATVNVTANAKMSLLNVVINPESGAEPISFSGNVANQTFTAGDSVNLDLSSNWSGTQTPFTFALTAGSLTGTGLTLSSSGVLSGTATESSVTGLVITGTDNDTNTADSNSFNITINAAPTGHNVSISDDLPSLSSSMSVTFSETATGTITISNWANNTGTPLPNLTGVTVNVRSLVDGSTVYRTTTASTDAGSDCAVSDAAIVTGTDYEVSAIKFNGVDYDIGIAIITAT